MKTTKTRRRRIKKIPLNVSWLLTKYTIFSIGISAYVYLDQRRLFSSSFVSAVILHRYLRYGLSAMIQYNVLLIRYAIKTQEGNNYK